ncbi:SpoIIE family protein phosphatase [Streptomyces sp. NPDC055092]
MSSNESSHGHRLNRSAGNRRNRLLSPLGIRSVVGQMFVLQVVIVFLLAIGAVVALVLSAQQASTRDARNRSLAIAQGFASSPGVAQALVSSTPTAVLQPRIKEAQKASTVDFLGVLNRDGTYEALSSVAGRPGIHTTTNMAPLLAGRTTTEKGIGSLGPQIRAYVPVKAPDGTVVGAVGAGVTLEHVSNMVAAQLSSVLGSTVGAVAVTIGGAALISRRLWGQTRGLGPVEITRMYEHHDAVLHAVREGVLIIGGDGRLLLANDEARRLLGLAEDAQGLPITDLNLDPPIAELLASGRPASDEVHMAGDHLLSVNVRPTAPYGGPAGSAVTLRDTTELGALAGRAETARERLSLLYDAGVSIGTTLDVVRTAEKLAEVAVPRFADLVTVDLLDPVLEGGEPTEESTGMRRAAVSSDLPGSPLQSVGELIKRAPNSRQLSSVINGQAVLEANLHEAEGWRTQDPERSRKVLDAGIHSLITVPLRARGVVLGLGDFWRAEGSEPFDEEDLSFAQELAARAAVAIDNARRYTRERTVAVTLQRSLLPQTLPEQTALEVAYRYLPAQAGVGGDWFDVIPLSGARVALVVGDVVGHGVHASATMGRLRTAVHNFSTLDLSPDELLTRLDELVAYLDIAEASSEREGVTGATCLYAIYDPVSGACALARAGHPGPAVMHPAGNVTFPDTPVSPPLGLGSGLPFETATLQLPEGSQLALFTDGLIESRHRDLDTGLELLRDALSHADHTPEQACQTVFDTLLSERPRDDVALLIARTKLLGPDQVADWDVPADPAAVSRIRADAGRQLLTWGLTTVAFSTELIISELVTNAIRYGAQPIRLRLLHDRSLICEVADGSSTSPHLRRARPTDEGGRGLFLVARCARRWGTRYTPHGKIIWTEQPLHEGPSEPGMDLADALLDQWDE